MEALTIVINMDKQTVAESTGVNDAALSGGDKNPAKPPLKLNYKRTFLIGFAFFGILLLWSIYNTYCSKFLTISFAQMEFGKTSSELTNSEKLDVQYLVGIVMALDNVAALFLMPIFGRLSDKTHSKRWGHRMPYIMIGTIISAIAFPFIPVFYYYNNIAGMIGMMVIVLIFMMAYRSPAVALMPDMTPKPLRSRANGIINIVGYIGGGVAALLGIFLPFSKYLNEGSFYIIFVPFLVASIVMVIAAFVLFFTINENKVSKEVADDMRRGEEEAEVIDKVEDDKPMSKANKRTLILILTAEVLWFMSFNAIETFFGNYTLWYLDASDSSSTIATTISGACGAIMFLFAGRIADKIGRKWTIFIGLCVVTLSYFAFCFVTPTGVASGTSGYNTFPWVLYLIFAFVGFGSAMIHNCSFPMVVELCTGKNIGKFTGYYYAASMIAQSITPIVIGFIFRATGWQALPIYSCCLMAAAGIVFAFVKNAKSVKVKNKKGLEALGDDD
jgi:MFS family permease